MQRRVFILAVLAALTLLVGLAVFWSTRTPAQRAERLTERMAIKLLLSDQQKQKMWPLAVALVQEEDAWDAERKAMGASLGDDFNQEALDPAMALSDLKTGGADLLAARQRLVAALADFHGVLNANQRAQAAVLLRHYVQRRRQFGWG